MLGKLLRSAFIGSIMLMAVGLTAPAKAENVDTASSNEAPVCMARPFKGIANVQPSQRGKSYRIVANPSAAKALESKGFAIVDCKAVDLELVDKKKSWRDEICQLADFGNEAVQAQLTKAYGESPTFLCAVAERVIGPWDRQKR